MGKQKGGRSKRDRKHREVQSLRFKHGNPSLETLADDDIDRLVEDSNALILPAKADKAAADGDSAAPEAAPPPEKHLSKSQLRKLRRIQEEKEKRDKRADVLQTLAQHQLNQEQLQLLRPVAARGQRETKKQALRRALQLERAGVSLPSAVRLYQERQRPQTPPPGASSEEDHTDGADSGGSGSSSDGEDPAGGEATRPTSKKQRMGGLPGEAEQAAGQPAQAAAMQQQHPQPPRGGDVDEKQAAARRKQQAEELRRAARDAKLELGVGDRRDDDEDGRPSAPAHPGRQAAPAGKPRVVLVERRPEIQAVREGLPILGMEQEVMEAVSQSDVVVLCGETGCGKTTQVPQFLYEAGYGCRLFPERAGAVGVTQPRRVAAVSTAERVADELDSKLGAVVGYQVRYDKRVGGNTAIKFMTDGILLREVQEDFLLRRYSALVVDEAHERSLNTDILCGLLSRVVALRRRLADAGAGAGPDGQPVHPLKLIIMSATLRTDDFVQNARLFPQPPPLVRVPARQFPVTVHFSRRTELHDYVGAAFKKVSQVHRSLPPGGVLVFLTGQREVEHLCRRLRAAFNPKPRRGGGAAGPQQGPGATGGGGQEGQEGGDEGAADLEAAAAAAREEAAAVDAFSCDAAEAGGDAALLDALLEEDRAAGGEGAAHDDYDDESSGDEEEVVVLGGEGFTPQQIAEAEADFERRLGISLADFKGSDAQAAGGASEGPGPLHVLPLYAMLPPAAQARVFRAAPAGHRLVVVATNVAETSLTIPGIRYVVDAGRSKQRLLESAAGLSRFDVRWVSKASAEQRAGRAGRTGPGHCYRLYSSAHFNDTFPQHTPPEIRNAPLEGVVLSLKALGVDKPAGFPFPTPPEPEALAAAERCLLALAALDGASGQLTALGRAMAAFPLSPRHARMLLEAAAAEEGREGGSGGGSGGDRGRRRALPYAVALAAVLSVDSPFVHVDSLAAAPGQEAEGAAAEAEQGQGQDAAGAAAAQQKEEAKRRRAAARQAHAAFRVGDSDALSALRTLCAFEAAGEGEAFCRRSFLHFKNLREAAALHRQLARALEAQAGGALPAGGSPTAPPPRLSAAALAPPGGLPPPAPGVCEALRRALAAGWADQVARRVRSLDHIRGQEGQGGRSRAVRYRPAAPLDEDVFLHPASALHSAAPELAVYTELVRTAKRPYMAGLTAVEPRWLADVAAPLCAFSPPLADPPPFYAPARDEVLCWHDVTFGRHAWPLPRAARRHPDPTERCAVFGAALLEGKVLPGFAGLRKGLAVPPHMLLRPELRVHRRAADLLAALTAAEVDSRAALAARWAAAPGFLRPELAACMQKGLGGSLLAAWDALRAEAAAAEAAPAAAAAGKKKRQRGA